MGKQFVRALLVVGCLGLAGGFACGGGGSGGARKTGGSSGKGGSAGSSGKSGGSGGSTKKGGGAIVVKSNTGPIGASVIQVTPAGSKSLVLLGRGKKHNVKVGDTGRMGGFKLRVVKVFATRCRAKVSAPASKISGVKRARIVRK